MASKRVAVDVGASTVRVVELSKSGDTVSAVKGGRLPLRANPALPPDRLKALQNKGLDKLWENVGPSGRSVSTGVSGQNAFIRNIKLPPIPESRVDQIVRYEVQQTIPFRIDEIAMDYQLLQEEAAPEMEVVLVAMKGDVCEQFINHLGESKLKPSVIGAHPLALYNAYVYNGYSNEADCTAILDFGATTTTILIESDGHLRFTRCVGLGGNDITQLLANELGKRFEEAEMIKMQAGILFPPPGPNAKVSEEHQRISAVLTKAIDRLLGEIKLSIGYFRTQSGAAAPSRAFICGGGAQMRNLRPLIADRLGVQVEFLNPFRNVEVPADQAALKRQALEYATAVGHGLRGLVDCPIAVNLEPPRFAAARRRRVNLVCYSLSVVALIGATFLTGQLLVPNVEAERKKIDAYKQVAAPYQAVEEQRQALDIKKRLLKAKFELLNNEIKNEVPALIIMEMLADAMSGEVFIEKMAIDGSKKELHLEGYAVAGEAEKNFRLIYQMKEALLAVAAEKRELERKVLEGEEERVQWKMTLRDLPDSYSSYRKKREAYLKKLAAQQPGNGTGAAEAAQPEPAAAEAAE